MLVLMTILPWIGGRDGQSYNKIRKKIRALRVSMFEAEAIMREQITRDEGCA
jgi:hypothetical protein